MPSGWRGAEASLVAAVPIHQAVASCLPAAAILPAVATGSVHCAAAEEPQEHSAAAAAALWKHHSIVAVQSVHSDVVARSQHRFVASPWLHSHPAIGSHRVQTEHASEHASEAAPDHTSDAASVGSEHTPVQPPAASSAAGSGVGAECAAAAATAAAAGAAAEREWPRSHWPSCRDCAGSFPAGG